MKFVRRPPPRKHAINDRVADEQAKVLSAEEKRELIHAHVAARHGRPSGYGLGYYIAISASCLVVVTGWWLTLDKNLKWGADTRPDPVAEELTREAEELRAAISDQTPGLQADIEQAKRAVEQAKRVIEEAQVNISTSTFK